MVIGVYIIYWVVLGVVCSNFVLVFLFYFIIVLYVLFVLFLWIVVLIVNFFLCLYFIGKYVLIEDEKMGFNIVGGLVGLLFFFLVGYFISNVG